MIEALKKQTKAKADIIVDFGTWNASMMDCSIYANPDEDNTLVVLFQDKDHPERKVQITLTKESPAPIETTEPKG